MDVKCAGNMPACKSSCCKCHGRAGERESAGFLCRNAESSCNSEGVGRLTGTRGSGFLALLTQFGHLSLSVLSWKTDALSAL